jgi:hypothetical protein
MITYLTFIDELKLIQQSGSSRQILNKIILLINKYEKIVDENEENENKGILL